MPANLRLYGWKLFVTLVYSGNLPALVAPLRRSPCPRRIALCAPMSAVAPRAPVAARGPCFCSGWLVPLTNGCLDFEVSHAAKLRAVAYWRLE
jgi:hypothetical protein